MQDNELLNEFVEEAQENLGDLETRLLQIDDSGPDVDPDLVNTVFRAVHSVKGAAGFLGLKQINLVAHRLENVLGKIRDRELAPDSSSIDVLLTAADRLRCLVEDVDNSNRTNNEDLVARLERLCESCTEVVEKVVEAENASYETPTEPGANVMQESQEVTDRNDTPVTEGLQQDTHLEKLDEKDSPTGNHAAASSSRPGADPTIRVSVRVLDQLMNLAGELVLSRNQLLRVFGDQSRTDSSMDTIVSGIDQVTTELQDSIMQTRMQPIGNVFQRFPRVIRSLSASLGKKISMRMEGTEVETDKTIVEAIADPLTHLVRNSCDHGIEEPSKRLACGKDPSGTLVLRAYHKAGKMVIEIVDDGAGIDPKRLREKAVENGVVSAEDADKMSDHDAVNLVFSPGLSTAKAVTDVSGRGVGMDVVRTNIEKLGGNVDVTSEKGTGTTIRITLPLTLAIVPSMIVSVDQRPYALPQANIVELVQTGGQEKRIERVSNVEVLRLRGDLLPLVRLRKVLGLESSQGSAEPQENQLVVVEVGRSRYALAVDRVLDSEEIVVKPLGRHLSNLPLLAGSTILGDGRVAMILDAGGIAGRAAVANDTESRQEVTANQVASLEDTSLHRVVLLSLNQVDHFAIPMDLVSRIERVNSDAIDSVGNRKVIQYRGGTLQLLQIDEVVPVAGADATNNAHIVVFNVQGREVGIIAPHLDDICNCDFNECDTATGQPAVLGIAVIKGHTTRIMDVHEFAKIARPEWFDSSPSHAVEEEYV